MLVTGIIGDGIGLTLVFGHVGVNKLNNIRANGGQENSGFAWKAGF